jgi:K+:H+ antiporter
VPHETALIATISLSLAFAFLGGFIAVRLRLPPLGWYPGMRNGEVEPNEAT